MSGPATHVLAAIERNRKSVWAICYRMTGTRADADDLAQEAVARAIERASQATELDATGWLLRLTTRLCLDHLRHERIVRRTTELVDPLEGMEWAPVDWSARAADCVSILREDVRFAVVVALSRLSAKQRAVVILHDVCGRSLDEVAELLGTNANAAKALLHRARVALSSARHREDGDVPVDREVVERFARAIEAGAIDALQELLAADAWGVVDGGGVVVTATKPTFGRDVIARQWANAKRKLGQPVTATVRVLNGEPAIVVRLASIPEIVVAVVHLESREGHVVALRVQRDPARLAMLGAAG